MTDEEKKVYKQQFNKEHYESVLLQYPKDKQYKAKIKELIGDQKTSVNQWILSAVDAELTRAANHQHGYFSDNYEELVVRYFKDRNLKSRIKAIAKDKGVSVDRWILDTIEEKLQSDQIPH